MTEEEKGKYIEQAKKWREIYYPNVFDKNDLERWYWEWMMNTSYLAGVTEAKRWRTDTPPKDVELELLCVMFDEKEYRTLKENSWGGYNRSIYQGKFNGSYFYGYSGHCPGDPYPSVVAWREIDYGEPYYEKCLGEFK